MIPVQPTPRGFYENEPPSKPYVPLWLRRKQARVLGMARAGAKMDEIAVREDLHRDTIEAWCRAAGVPVPSGQPHREKSLVRPPKHTERCAAMIAQGMSDEDIAKTLGRATAVVRVWRMRHEQGVPMSGREQRQAEKEGAA